VRDNEENRPPSVDLTNLTNYEDFLRRHLPHFVRSALETAVNNDIQPMEERLRSQILNIIEQAQNRAFSTYRAMADSALGAEPSIDSGYISDPSRASAFREGDVNSLTSNLSTTEPGGAHKSSEAASAQFMGTYVSFERTSPIQQDINFLYVNPSDSYHQTQETVSNDPLSLEGDNTRNISSIPLLKWGRNLDIDLDAFSWDFPFEGDSG
jgi:hypothetical protein